MTSFSNLTITDYDWIVIVVSLYHYKKDLLDGTRWNNKYLEQWESTESWVNIWAGKLLIYTGWEGLLETFLNKCKFQDHQFKQVIQMQFAEV